MCGTHWAWSPHGAGPGPRASSSGIDADSIALGIEDDQAWYLEALSFISGARQKSSAGSTTRTRTRTEPAPQYMTGSVGRGTALRGALYFDVDESGQFLQYA